MHVIRSAGAGGVETHVAYVLQMLRDMGAAPSLVSLSSSKPVQTGFSSIGCPVTTLSDGAGWGWRTLRACYELWRVIRRSRPDIVHVHGARPILVGTLAARLAGVENVVCSLHGAHNLMAVKPDGTSTGLGEWFARVSHGVGFALCRRLIVCAERLRHDAIVSLNTVLVGMSRRSMRKLRIVYHGIDVARFDRPGPRKVDTGEFVVGTLSRLDEPKKGIAVLLEAAALVQARGIRIGVRIAGSGYSRESLERKAVELALSRCEFLGFVADSADFYRTLDVFVLASFSEGMPLVNLEAMASGVPVVTTDVGGAAEAVLDGSCGKVVPPGDAYALAEALCVLARDRALADEYAAAGQVRVRQYFSKQSMFRNLVHVYAEICPGRHLAERAGMVSQAGQVSNS